MKPDLSEEVRRTMSEEVSEFSGESINPPEVSRQPRSVPKTRLVVVEMIHHQSGNEDPVSASPSFVRWLPNEEAAYSPQRKVKVGIDWQEVDVGWVKTVGMLVIVNHHLKVKMKAESVQDTKGVLEVCLASITTTETDGGVGMWAKEKVRILDIPHLTVLPEESTRFTPVPGKRISIRCREGEGVYSVFAVEG